MRVLVVGGTGVISTGIVKALLEFGHEVTVFNRGRRPNRLPAGVRCLTGDRQDRPAFEAAMQAAKPEVAIDMLCFKPEDAESGLRAFRGCQQLIYCSTASTYGGPFAELPVDEQTPLRPVSNYGRNKLAADNVFLAAHARGELPVTIFKPYLIYGPGFAAFHQLSVDGLWIDRMRRGKPLLVGNPQLLVSILHADDAGLAFAGTVGRERCLGQIYNLTSPRPLSWAEYYERVAAGLGCRVQLVEAPVDWLCKTWPKKTGMLDGEFRWSRVFRLDKLQRDVPEFQPRVPIGVGVPDNVAWMEQQGLVGDCRSDDTEDRLIAAVDGLWRASGVERA